MKENIFLDHHSTECHLPKVKPNLMMLEIKSLCISKDNFETLSFLPNNEQPLGEDGLCTKGYFKAGGIVPANCNADITKNKCELVNIKAQINNYDNNPKPLITIITVVFNGEKYLEETILSVINQTYDNVEYIIIDGGSSDGTLDIIRKYEYAIDYWISEKDKGIYDAMNKGINFCNGEYVLFLNVKDYLLSHSVIHESVNQINLDLQKKTIYYGNIEVIHKGQKKIKKPNSLNNILFSMPFCHQAAFCSGQYLKNNLFSLDYRYASDFHFFRSAFLNEIQFKNFDIDISHYDLSGVSSKQYISYLKEMIRAINANKQNLTLFILSILGLLKLNFKFLIKYIFLIKWKSPFFQ